MTLKENEVSDNTTNTSIFGFITDSVMLVSVVMLQNRRKKISSDYILSEKVNC